tara:strand:- start:7755 stop:8264 length:510 start_codon:yes stop_codon:yes gene_type:complete
MDLKWDYQLKPGQRSNPVVHVEQVDLPASIVIPGDADLLKVFKTGGYRLQTWGRPKDASGKDIRKMAAHWIAVRGGTPLHTDPAYPRYSHHLKIRVDPGTFVRGMNKVELELARGMFYILDAHSPHQVFHKLEPKAWNVAVSIDNDRPIIVEQAIAACLRYAEKGGILA